MLQSLENAFLKFFGDIKVFKFPFFMIYEPEGYRVKGFEIRDVIHQVKPGDILIRGYINYLDGYFIPGYFSHAGLYVGEITEDQRQFVSESGAKVFKTGEQMVIHSMAEGVFLQDVIDFCRCDYMAILRFPDKIKADAGTSFDWEKCDVNSDERAIMKRLASGEELDFDEVWPVVLKVALVQLGKSYDFRFNFTNFNDLSCTEFVYFCYQCLRQYHKIEPEFQRVMFIKKLLLIPDQFINNNKLINVWNNRFASEKISFCKK